jgi:hypothetical protein
MRKSAMGNVQTLVINFYEWRDRCKTGEFYDTRGMCNLVPYAIVIFRALDIVQNNLGARDHLSTEVLEIRVLIWIIRLDLTPIENQCEDYQFNHFSIDVEKYFANIMCRHGFKTRWY